MAYTTSNFLQFLSSVIPHDLCRSLTLSAADRGVFLTWVQQSKVVHDGNNWLVWSIWQLAKLLARACQQSASWHNWTSQLNWSSHLELAFFCIMFLKRILECNLCGRESGKKHDKAQFFTDQRTNALYHGSVPAKKLALFHALSLLNCFDQLKDAEGPFLPTCELPFNRGVLSNLSEPSLIACTLIRSASWSILK